ncbi:hypothetical protein C2E31_13510 [Rhodopirellula baltica]|nr:hypothetical protein C2E31_13510 [Rhodopirellula baltica]
MKLFISYRRDDTRDLSALLSDRLRRRYGKANVFLDSASIGAGSEWRKLLITELHTCDVLIAVIGDDWLELRDDQGQRRIDNPEDEVRREIVTALDRGIPVVPLLAEGTKMPERESLPEPLRRLHERQWIEVRSDQYFDNDVNLLCNHIDVLRKSNRHLKMALAGTTAIVLVLVGTVIGLSFRRPHDTPQNSDQTANASSDPLPVSPTDVVRAQSEGSIVGLWEQRFFEAGRWNGGGIYEFYTDTLGQLQIRSVIAPSNSQSGTNNHNVALDGSKFKTEGEVLTWNADWGAYGIGSFRLEKKNANLYVGSAFEEDGTEYRKNEFHRVIE